MAIKEVFTIESKKELVKDVYQMVLKGNATNIKHPGQFIEMQIPGHYLRRPMSINDYTDDSITIIFKTVGVGTKTLSEMAIGDTLDILVGLGNGFNDRKAKKAIVIGGGLGVPPMYALAKKLKAEGVEVCAVLGFNSTNDVFYKEEFEKVCPTYVATMDGSVGEKGTVIDVIKNNNLTFDKYYSCGPVKMLEALATHYENNGFLSYEARMGCGFGACMGCSMKVKPEGYKRVCKEGPVFKSEEVIING